MLSGLQGSDQDREDLQGRLRLAETRAEELTESLRAATSSMEQYRSMAQSLEESLDREKQVQTKPMLNVCVWPLMKLLTTTTQTMTCVTSIYLWYFFDTKCWCEEINCVIHFPVYLATRQQQNSSSWQNLSGCLFFSLQWAFVLWWLVCWLLHIYKFEPLFDNNQNCTFSPKYLLIESLCIKFKKLC